MIVHNPKVRPTLMEFVRAADSHPVAAREVNSMVGMLSGLGYLIYSNHEYKFELVPKEWLLN